MKKQISTECNWEVRFEDGSRKLILAPNADYIPSEIDGKVVRGVQAYNYGSITGYSEHDQVSR